MTAAVAYPDDLGALLGPTGPLDRPLRVLGFFAHPDDEVFCAGGTIARAVAAGAETAVASLTRGDAGQIHDATTATRRTLGATRLAELHASAAALGVAHVECLDLGDGNLSRLPFRDLVAQVRPSWSVSGPTWSWRSATTAASATPTARRRHGRCSPPGRSWPARRASCTPASPRRTGCCSTCWSTGLARERLASLHAADEQRSTRASGEDAD